MTKVIDSSGGGSAILADFDVSVDAVEVDWADPNSTTGGTRLVAILPGTYTLSESAVDGYERAPGRVAMPTARCR